MERAQTIRHRAIAGAALVVAIAVPLAGCGGDDDTTTVTETVQTNAEPQGAQKPQDGGSGGMAPPGAGAAKLKLGPRHFQTPSGNIGCFVSRRDARCDIREREWEPTPEPKSCKKIGLDYGQGIAVGRDHAEFVCAGDTVLGGPDTLAYGQNSRRGLFRCHSGPRGVTCTNAENGHGFFISRQSFRIF